MENKCGKCEKTFSNISNLRKHIKKFHPDESKTLAKYKKRNQDYSYTCNYCDKHFTHKHHYNFHLKKHKGHPSKKQDYPYNCNYCGKHFTHKHHYNYHLRKHHLVPEDGQCLEDNGSKKCPLCSYYSSYKRKMIMHFEKQHHINIKRSYKKFSTIKEFNQYLSTIENETKSRFVKKTSTGNGRRFECNRSGMYLPIENRCRALKTQGSNKINAFCPASLILKTNSAGKYCCEFLETHVGHENELGHLFLSEPERQSLAVKIASQLPFDEILDSVRDSKDSSINRLHLLKKKDLYNIERSYNLNSTSRHSSNESISVKSEVNASQSTNRILASVQEDQDLIQQKDLLLKKEDIIIIKKPFNIMKTEETKVEEKANLLSLSYSDKIKLSHKKALSSWYRVEYKPKFYFVYSADNQCPYIVREKSGEPCCERKCIDCNVCVHIFECTCKDFMKKGIICEHIHFCVINKPAIISGRYSKAKIDVCGSEQVDEMDQSYDTEIEQSSATEDNTEIIIELENADFEQSHIELFEIQSDTEKNPTDEQFLDDTDDSERIISDQFERHKIRSACLQLLHNIETKHYTNAQEHFLYKNLNMLNSIKASDEPFKVSNSKKTKRSGTVENIKIIFVND